MTIYANPINIIDTKVFIMIEDTMIIDFMMIKRVGFG
jgi:hypothetical protein